MSVQLIEVQRLTEQGLGRGLLLKWSDGTESELASLLLRKSCPCAECREKGGDRTHSRPLSGASQSEPAKSPGGRLLVISATIDEACNLQEVWPVGNYALGLRWGDKHDSGIYTFSLLRELSN